MNVKLLIHQICEIFIKLWNSLIISGIKFIKPMLDHPFFQGISEAKGKVWATVGIIGLTGALVALFWKWLKSLIP